MEALGMENLFSVLVTVCLIVEGVFMLDCHCNEDTQKDSGALEFLSQYPEPSYGWEVNTYNCLCCCTNKPSAVTSWFKKNATFKHWDTVKEGRGRYLNDEGRCVEFIQVGQYENGVYRCNATDGLNNISTETNVSVTVCTSDKSFPVVCKEPGDTQAELGRDCRLVCEGDFGCLPVDSSVWWSVLGRDGHVVNISTSSSTRYTVGHLTRLDTKTSLELTVHGVTEEDYNVHFVCSLIKGEQKPRLVFFHIVPLESKSFVVTHLGLVVCVSATAGVLLTVGLLLFKLCGSIPVYWLRCYTNRLPHRGVGHMFDVMMIGDEQTEEDKADFEAMLRERNYTLPQLPAGTSACKELDAVEKCVTVIVLVTEKTLNNHSALIGICADCKTRMIFVTKSTVDWKKKLEEYKLFSKTIPQLYTVVRWPSGSSFLASLQQRVFWATVQSSLPKPKIMVAEESQSLIRSTC